MLDKEKMKDAISRKKTNIEKLSAEIGINPSTFHRKMARNSFFLSEVDLIVAALELSSEEAKNIFFAK